MQYYRITDDKEQRGRWSLGVVESARREVDASDFLNGRRVESPSTLSIPVARVGSALPFTLAAFDVPIVSAAVAAKLKSLAPEAVQLLPVVVGGAEGEYFVANALLSLDCMDHSRSGVSYWTPPGVTPGAAPRPFTVVHLRLDVTKTGGHMIFRVEDWKAALVVSQDIKDALEPMGGMCFQNV